MEPTFFADEIADVKCSPKNDPRVMRVGGTGAPPNSHEKKKTDTGRNTTIPASILVTLYAPLWGMKSSWASTLRQ